MERIEACVTQHHGKSPVEQWLDAGLSEESTEVDSLAEGLSRSRGLETVMALREIAYFS